MFNPLKKNSDKKEVVPLVQSTKSLHKPLKSFEELEEELKDDIKVKVAGIDINGVLRGKTLIKSKFLSAVKNNGFGFCSVVFGWDLHDQPYFTPGKYSNASNGYPDLIAQVDLNSFRRIPWEQNIPFFLVDFLLNEKEVLAACPRNTLKGVIKKLNKLDLDPFCGVEFEFFNFKETPESLANSSGTPKFLTPGMFGYSLLRTSLNQGYVDDLFDQCYRFGIPLEGLHTETGPGVYEAALEYTNALEMGDRAALFKTSVKQLGLLHGITASFMAKPSSDLPGCSGHIHFSLRDMNGKNAFSGDNKGCSEVLEQFLAGLIEALPSILPFLAPTINSYKRMVESFWAPTKVSWGYDHRLASLRVIAPPACPPEATRIEVRVPGADINPPLAIAAVLAAGLYGISNKLTNSLPALELGQTLENYPGQKLARTLEGATEEMAKSDSVARKILGDEMIDHYALVCRNENHLYLNSVTDWELKRYIELI